MRLTAAALLAATLAGGLPAVAQDNPVVVELFTSQGCSACPPADALLGELSTRDNVIALALHVDYWDYIGWQDTFAEPAFTARQHGYGHAAGSTVVYTPQMIIGGQDIVVGYSPMAVADLIAAHFAEPDPVVITVAPNAVGFAVRAEWMAPSAEAPAMEVHVVTVLPHGTVEISRGENAGRVAEHYNIVRSWAVIAQWDGDGPFQAEVAPQSDLPHMVLFQASDHGRILGAARLE